MALNLGVIDKYRASGNLAFYSDYRKGSLLDYGLAASAVTVAGTPVWRMTYRGRGVAFMAANTALSYVSAGLMDLTAAGTLLVVFHYDRSVASGTYFDLLHKLGDNVLLRNGYKLYLENGNVRLVLGSAGASQTVSLALPSKEGVYSVVAKWDSTNVKLYHSSTSTSVAQTVVPTASGTALIVGNSAAAGSEQCNCPILSAAVFNTALTDAECAGLREPLVGDWEQGRSRGTRINPPQDLGNSELLGQIMEDVPVSFSTITGASAFLEIPSTQWRVTGNSWRITETSAGTKFLECTMAGQGVAFLKLPRFVGTYMFKVLKFDGAPRVQYTADLRIAPGGAQNSYYFEFSGGRFQAGRVVAGVATTLLQSAAGYIADNTEYDVCVARGTDGVTTHWIKGGAYTTWTLVTAGGAGSNPFTDTSTTPSGYVVFEAGTGDKIGASRIYYGRMDPTVHEIPYSSQYSMLSLSPAVWCYSTSVTLAAGNRVSSWTDNSGNGRHLTQATDVRQPGWFPSDGPGGYPYLQWDGSNDYLKTAAFTLNQPWTIIAVVRPVITRGPSGTYLIDGNATDSGAVYTLTNTDDEIHLWAGAAGPHEHFVSRRYYILDVTFNGVSSAIGKDGRARSVRNAGATNAGALILGARGDGAAAYARMRMTEFAVFPGDWASAAAREAAVNHLMTKYNI